MFIELPLYSKTSPARKNSWLHAWVVCLIEQNEQKYSTFLNKEEYGNIHGCILLYVVLDKPCIVVYATLVNVRQYTVLSDPRYGKNKDFGNYHTITWNLYRLLKFLLVNISYFSSIKYGAFIMVCRKKTVKTQKNSWAVLTSWAFCSCT